MTDCEEQTDPWRLTSDSIVFNVLYFFQSWLFILDPQSQTLLVAPLPPHPVFCCWSSRLLLKKKILFSCQCLVSFLEVGGRLLFFFFFTTMKSL